MPIYRQGDVLLRSIETFPSGETTPVRRIILAEGEATGHAHVLTCETDEALPIEMIEKAGTLYLRIAEPTPLRHEEHARIMVEPGTYEVKKGREYSPEAIRNVMD
jgi:hypothetical protein